MKAWTKINIRLADGRKRAIELVYRDEYLLVVNKPAGLRVIPDRWDKTLPNLRDLVARRLTAEGEPAAKVWVVHRIDADTSGLVLFALTPEVHREMSRQFEKDQVEKTYLAVVAGHPMEEAGKIDLPLVTGRTGKRKTVVSKNGKPSLTEYRVVERFRDYSLLEIYPRTGRTHQIRVHLEAVGCPLAVDPVYHRVESISIADLKPGVRFDFEQEPSALLNRLSLHAWKLRFIHPKTRQTMEIQAEIPKDFQALLKGLRKWNAGSR